MIHDWSTLCLKNLCLTHNTKKYIRYINIADDYVIRACEDVMRQHLKYVINIIKHYKNANEIEKY